MDSGDRSPPWRARIAPHGPDFAAPHDTTLLTAAEIAGLVLESSCRNGTCRTCICTLEEGRINYRIEWPGLSAEEKAEGLILPCVAYPSSDVTLRLPYRLPEWAE